MQNGKWTWAVIVLVAAAMVTGCDDGGNGENGGGGGKTGVAGKTGGSESPEVKLARLDLSSVGMPVTIEAPVGATAEKEESTRIVTVKSGATFELTIYNTPSDLVEYKKLATENKVAKLKRFIVDKPDTVFYEAEVAGTRQFRFVANVKAGGKVYSMKEGWAPNDTKAPIALMLRCALTLKAKFPAPKSSDPEGVALAIWRAVEKGDEKALLAHYDISPDDEVCLTQPTQVISAMTAFARAGIKAYGKEGWTTAAGKAEMEDMAQAPIPDLVGAETKVKCSIDGDKATCTLEGVNDPVVLVRKNGLWRGVLEDLPPKAQRPKVLKQMSAMVKGARSATSKISEPDATADEVFQEFIQVMGKALQE